MVTKRECLFLCVSLALTACLEPSTGPGVVNDQSWDDLSSEQRRAHLQRKIDESLDSLRDAEDIETWHAAAGEAARALSLFRVEGGLNEPSVYEELESEVEQLTSAPPTFPEPT